MNILTFDIEDWFHILDHNATSSETEWISYESRINNSLDLIINILNEFDYKATFFCLGWVAKKNPKVIDRIIDNGHEIGSHSMMHQLVYDQSLKEFEQDVECSIKTLEDISGKRVKYYRAPGFSITDHCKWAIEILIKYGIEVDSSIFPTGRAHGGFPSYPHSSPSIIRYNGVDLKELPIGYASIFGKSIIFSGGGYFRLFPYGLIKYWTKNSRYVMTYLHPRDLDGNQPVIRDLSYIRKFKSYVGLKGAESKLKRWLNDFEFIDFGTAIRTIDWGTVPIVDL